MTLPVGFKPADLYPKPDELTVVGPVDMISEIIHWYRTESGGVALVDKAISEAKKP